MLKIIKNPNEEEYNEVHQAVVDNQGYCPCRLVHTSDTKCVCKEFREQSTEGFCHCGLYKKIETDVHEIISDRQEDNE